MEIDVELPDTAADAECRLIARLSGEYILRSLRILADFHDGDLIDAIICQAILSANTAHLEGNGVGQGLPPCDGLPPPDHRRRPVSVLRLAGALGIPFETTRRHVNRMIQKGRCQRVRGGVIVSERVLSKTGPTQAARANVRNLRRLFRRLAQAGVALA